MRSSEEREFIREMRKKRLTDEAKRQAIQSTLSEMFGDVAATAALSFTGDGSDNIEGFAQRAKQLFGDGAASIFERIVVTIDGGSTTNGTTDGSSQG